MHPQKQISLEYGNRCNCYEFLKIFKDGLDIVGHTIVQGTENIFIIRMDL